MKNFIKVFIVSIFLLITTKSFAVTTAEYLFALVSNAGCSVKQMAEIHESYPYCRCETYLKRWSNNPIVGKIQKCLNKLGHDAGPVDNIFLWKTEKGVKCFQRQNDLTPDGVVGVETRIRLDQKCDWGVGQATFASYTPGCLDSSIIEVHKLNPYCYCGLTMKFGMHHSAVGRVQKCLNKLGHNSGLVDNIFGPKTRSAVKIFQFANYLNITGEVGEATLLLLEEKCYK